MKKTVFYSLLAVVSMMLLFVSCNKETTDTSTQRKLSVYLTDGPGDYQHVYVDIQSVEVSLDTCDGPSDDSCRVVQQLAINPGIYDLLTLSNGVDTLLASGFLLNGDIKRICLTLGSNNAVVVDSVSYPLTLPGAVSRTCINLGREHLDSLSSNTLQLYLDFDVERSIVRTGNGRYILKPVLHAFANHSTGAISGKVRPPGSYRLIRAASQTDTGYARPTPRHHNGEFMIRGLDAGTYDVFIEGANGYRDTSITGVQVSRNRRNDIGNIQMRR